MHPYECAEKTENAQAEVLSPTVFDKFSFYHKALYLADVSATKARVTAGKTLAAGRMGLLTIA